MAWRNTSRMAGLWHLAPGQKRWGRPGVEQGGATGEGRIGPHCPGLLPSPATYNTSSILAKVQDFTKSEMHLCAAAAAAAKSLQSCLTLCDPRDGSPPGSSIHGICQTRTLEWGAIALSDTCVLGSSKTKALFGFHSKTTKITIWLAYSYIYTQKNHLKFFKQWISQDSDISRECEMFTRNVCFYENKKSCIDSLELKERNCPAWLRLLKYYSQPSSPTCPCVHLTWRQSRPPHLVYCLDTSLDVALFNLVLWASLPQRRHLPWSK